MTEALQLPQPDHRLAWFTAAKLGLFIHWGPYSVAGVEASWPIMAPDLALALFGPQPRIAQADYIALPKRFNPVEYNPHHWLQIASQAGAKYIVMTAKHHDGFCMFDAPGTDYKITRTPYVRDVCAELAKASSEAGLRLCFYYSQPDMHHAGYRDVSKPAITNWLGEPRRPGWASYLDYMETHLRKLLTDYGSVAALWFDGLAGHQKYNPARLRRMIQELSPDTLINDRLDQQCDFITPEQMIPDGGIPVRHERRSGASDRQIRLLIRALGLPLLGPALLRKAQQYAEGNLALSGIPTVPNPAPHQFQPWETCLTLNRTWAYNPRDNLYKSRRQLLRALARTASLGGNLLLNVGPTPQGTFPAEAVDRLLEIGSWLEINGAAIYDTTYGPLQDLPFGVTTATDKTVYLHIFDWPKDGQIALFAPSLAVSRCTLLAAGEPLQYTQSQDRLSIRCPTEAPDPDVSVIALDLLPTDDTPSLS